MAVMKTATFGRLARIQQLGLSSWVFPGATHTRSAHSIGVMHAVGRLATHLDLEPNETEMLRMGGLLHDIGQYPLSHCIETVYRSIGDPGSDDEVFENAGALRAADAKRPYLQRVTKLRPSAGLATDKAVGSRLILKRPDLLATFHQHERDDEFVKELALLVSGQQPDSLRQQLLNSDYDCDRLDYVRRDSTEAGVQYGLFDFDFLIETFQIRNDPPTSSNRIIAIEETKGLAALEQYLMARYNMYSQIVFHKTARSLELLAKAAFLGLAEAGCVYGSYMEVTAAAETSNDYLAFDDSYFWSQLFRNQDNSDLPDPVRDAIRRVIQREPLKLAYEYKSISEQNSDQSYGLLLKLHYHDAQLEAVASEAGIDPASIVIDVVPPVDFVPGYKDIPADQFQRYLNDAAAGVVDERDLFRSIQLAPRVWDGDKTRLMTSRPGSLLGQMLGKKLFVIRFYLTEHDDDGAKRLAAALRRWSDLPKR